MSEISKVMFDNFNLLFAFAAVWTLLFFSWMLWKRKKAGLFSDGEPKSVVFEEKTASGRSHKNWYCKIGGANNCLRIVVTTTELWVTPQFPFSAVAAFFDMDHRIDRAKITSVVPQERFGKESFLVHFTGKNNVTETIEVTPKNATLFRDAIMGNRSNAA